MKRPRLLALVTLVAVVLGACGSDAEPAETTGTDPAQPGEQLAVVVTTTIWGDIVSNVTRGDAAVEVLFPIGADPHDYQLSAAQAATMQKADLVVVNGLALEEGLLDVIESLEADGANVLEVAGLLDPIEFGEDGGHSDEDGDHDEEGDHEHESFDPHIWMDPLRVAGAVELIAAELTALDPSVDWEASAISYADQLRALDAEVVSMLTAVPNERRKLVTNHEAFGYFVQRYGLDLVGTVVPGGATLADPSSAELAQLIDVMKDESINVVFAETIEPSALADAVAAEIDGATVIELFTGSLGESGSGAETYIDLMRTNAMRIADALS